MAHKLFVSGGPPGLKFIYNVSKHVGPLKENPNDADDVQLVQFLIREVSRTARTIPAGIASPIPTGRFDATTGFWIYHFQRGFLKKSNPGTVVDGVVSPAKGLAYSATASWLIAHLNNIFRIQFPAAYDNLPNNQELSPSLRASLK